MGTASSFFLIWVFVEATVFFTIPLLAFNGKHETLNTESVIIYFIYQAVARVLIMTGFSVNDKRRMKRSNHIRNYGKAWNFSISCMGTPCFKRLFLMDVPSLVGTRKIPYLYAMFPVVYRFRILYYYEGGHWYYTGKESKASLTSCCSKKDFFDWHSNLLNKQRCLLLIFFNILYQPN